MKIFYAGTPWIAVPALESLSKHFTVCGVLTNPDRKSGRGRKITVSPVKGKALELGLDVYQPEIIDSSFCKNIEALEPDILVTFAYGKIFKTSFLNIFSRECINIHPSLLPKYRGPSPLSAVILAGDSETGITVQKMAPRMDTGDIIVQHRFPLDGTETLESLTGYTALKSAEIIISALIAITNNTHVSIPQEEEKATYCGLIKKEDGLVDWNLPAALIERMYRAYYPWPGIFTYFEEKLIIITDCSVVQNKTVSGFTGYKPGAVVSADRNSGLIVKTGNGMLRINKLKMQASKEIDYKSFINSSEICKGSVFGR